MLRWTLKCADYFLPSNFQEGERRSRARTSIFLFLISILLVSLTTFATYLNGTMLEAQASIYALAVCCMIFCLLLIKKTRHLEWITVVYLCFIGTLITLDCLFVAKSLFSGSLQVFPLAILFGFFICSSWKKRAVLAAWYASCAIVCFFAMQENGFAIPYGMDQEKFIAQLVFSTAAKAVIAVLTINFYVRVKSIAEHDLENEMNWQMQSLKLGEISMMTQLLVPHLKIPLEGFRRELSKLKTDINLITPVFLQAMQVDVSAMTRIAQGTAWIYKAYRNESIGRTPSSVFQDQIAYLLTRKTEAARTQIQMIIEPHEEFTLEGPLPTVLLLILTLFERTLSRMTPYSNSLRIETIRTNGTILWRIKNHRNDERADHEMIHDADNEGINAQSLRDELIEELILLSKATIKEGFQGEDRILEVSGAWVAQEKAKNEPLQFQVAANA